MIFLIIFIIIIIVIFIIVFTVKKLSHKKPPSSNKVIIQSINTNQYIGYGESKLHTVVQMTSNKNDAVIFTLDKNGTIISPEIMINDTGDSSLYVPVLYKSDILNTQMLLLPPPFLIGIAVAPLSNIDEKLPRAIRGILSPDNALKSYPNRFDINLIPVN